MEGRKQRKKRPDSHSHRMSLGSKPELEEFFVSVNERMKNLAIAQKSYRSRNDKELSVQPGDFFEVLDDVGSWWCLRAPSGRTGHVPKTHLKIIQNPVKEAEQFYNQPVDPIVVKVPVIVKASVQHQEIEETVKPEPPRRPVTPSPPIPPPQVAPPKELEPPASAPVEQRAAPVPPPQPIFPPLRSYHDRLPCHTVVKEIIREVSPYRHSRRARTRHQSKRDASLVSSDGASSTCSHGTSSSSGVESWISDGGYEKVPHRQQTSKNRRPMRQPQRSSRRSVMQPPKPMESLISAHHSCYCCHERSKDANCRYRSICCHSSARSSIGDMSQRENLSKKEHLQPVQQSQPQQPMIILLEAPKQEATQSLPMMEERSVDDYYDPYNPPQISIMLPSNTQIAPQLSAYTPLQSQQPQFAQAPAFYNWSPQYY